MKAAEDAGGGRADVEAILRALVGPTLRGCLGPENEQSTAAHFMIRASIESVPPIRRIKNREIDHLRKFAAAMRRSLPDCGEAELYWGLHFALAMAHQTIRDSERLTKLSEGKCDLDDVEGVIERIVAVAVMALTADAETKTPAKQRPATDGDRTPARPNPQATAPSADTRFCMIAEQRSPAGFPSGEKTTVQGERTTGDQSPTFPPMTKISSSVTSTTMSQ